MFYRSLPSLSIFILPLLKSLAIDCRNAERVIVLQAGLSYCKQLDISYTPVASVMLHFTIHESLN